MKNASVPPTKPAKVKDAPGHGWRPRRDHWVCIWQCQQEIARAGYPLKSQRLWPPDDDPLAPLTDEVKAGIQRECQRLQDQMLAWHRGTGLAVLKFTGTIKSLIECYRGDPDSPYRNLRPYSRKCYDERMDALERSIGGLPVASMRGREFLKLFAIWSEPKRPEGPRRVPRAHAMITMLRILFGFGVTFEYGYAHCLRLKTILGEMKFEGRRRRTEELTAEQATAVRARAHAVGRPSVALAQAIQSDTGLRQKDAIGEWVPDSEPGLSEVHAGRLKWMFGLHWHEITPMLVLTHRLSKSVRGRRAVADPHSGKVKVFDLKLYPMVMEELARIPVEQRVGPVIKDERTGLPYSKGVYTREWRKIARAAGVPDNVQNRDSRAGRITRVIEAVMDEALEAAREDAGHSRKSTTLGYNRGEARQTAKVAMFRQRAKREET